MPNFQQWLNAWVKVSTKQSHADLGNSSSHGHRARSRQQTKALSQHPPSSSELVDLTLLNKTTTCTSTANQNVDGKFQHSSLSSGDVTLSTSTGPISCNPHAILVAEPAPRRSSSRKQHKRRLYRTNSPSDLIREQVRLRDARSTNNTRHSNNGQQQQPPYERSEAFQSRESRRHSNTFEHQRSQTKSKSKRHRQPPPTLHHSMEDDFNFDSSDSSFSVSPTQTDTTTLRSHEKQRYDDDDNINSQPMATSVEEEEEEDIDSNEVLFNVADFFGTEIPELRVRAKMASNGSHHLTHQGQHGVEDEQPHYLRPFLDDPNAMSNNNSKSNSNNSMNHNSHLDHSNHRNHHSPPPTFSDNHTIYNKNKDNIPDSHHRRTRSLHDSAHATQLLNEREEEARIAYPRPLSSRQYHAKSASISVPPKGGLREAAIRPTESTAMGLVVGGVRSPFFHYNPASTAASTEATESTAATNDNNRVGKPNCASCQIFQAELRHTLDSLEYMRTTAIRKEFTCHKCGSAGEPVATSNGSTQGNKKPTVVKNASEQLLEVTGRHKNQVEQLMKERVSNHVAAAL
jgi:hypothetical protein